MSYDPFQRGPFPVGVRSDDLTDVERARRLPVEIWYPADAAHAGQDLAGETQDHYRLLAAVPPVPQEAVRDARPAAGRFPVVAFSHGFGGHRRQTTHLCTHLASHGYVVVSVDHTGNTMMDMMQQMIGLQAGAPPPDPLELLGPVMRDRPRDVSFVLDAVLDGTAGGVAALADPDRIGVTGHSFGGWTTLVTTGSDPRVRAALPLAPAGGESPLPANPLVEALELDWQRSVPTLYLVAEHDTLLPLPGMHGLLRRTRAPRRMVVLKNADHLHFCDRVEEMHELFRTVARMAPVVPGLPDIAQQVRPMDELCPGEHAYPYVRGLGLAHMDAHLKESEAAAEFLSGDLESAFSQRGIDVEVID